MYLRRGMRAVSVRNPPPSAQGPWKTDRAQRTRTFSAPIAVPAGMPRGMPRSNPARRFAGQACLSATLRKRMASLKKARRARDLCSPRRRRFAGTLAAEALAAGCRTPRCAGSGPRRFAGQACLSATLWKRMAPLEKARRARDLCSPRRRRFAGALAAEALAAGCRTPRCAGSGPRRFAGQACSSATLRKRMASLEKARRARDLCLPRRRRFAGTLAAEALAAGCRTPRCAGSGPRRFGGQACSSARRALRGQRLSLRRARPTPMRSAAPSRSRCSAAAASTMPPVSSTGSDACRFAAALSSLK